MTTTNNKEWKSQRGNLQGKFECRVPRIARRDENAFPSNQCKEIDKNIRMGKTRDLLKKTRDTKGIFHAKMGTVNDKDSMDLTETEDIKKR